MRNRFSRVAVAKKQGMVLNVHKELTGPRAIARMLMFVTDREVGGWKERDWQFASELDDGSESPVVLRMTPAHQTSALHGFFHPLDASTRCVDSSASRTYNGEMEAKDGN